MKKLSLSLLCLAMCLSVFAGEIYVFHDSSCMDKLQFKEKSLTADYKLKTTGNLVSYNIRANQNEIVRLDINPEGDQVVSDMPIGVKNCGDLVWDEQFAKEVNAGTIEVYVVTLHEDRYRISAVDAASYFYSSDDEISFGDSAFGFSFDMGEFDQNADLLTYGLKSRVQFSFADDMHCPGEYHFYKSTKNRNINENELVIVPSIGVVKNYTISKKLNRNLNELSLVSVNDMPLSTYMEQSCNKNTEVDMVQVEQKPTEKVVEKITEAPAMETKIEKAPVEIAKKDIVVAKTATQTKTVATEQAKSLAVASLPGTEANQTVLESCHHIYRNADTGFYYDRNTGKTAEGECGGITYVDGVMQNSDYQYSTATTALVSIMPQEDEFVAKGGEVVVTSEVVIADETPSVEIITEVSELVETPAADTKTVNQVSEKVIVKEVKPKIVYKEPTVIYKETNPIIIDETLEPEDTKIVAQPSTRSVATNLDCTVSPRIGFHLVKKGETLYRLSNMYNVSIEDLMDWNNLDGSAISVCQLLRVQAEISLTQTATQIPTNEFTSKGGSVAPVAKTIVTKSAPVKRVYHYISQGETLYAISKKYGVQVEDLKRLNKLDGNYLKPGWRLLIPNSSDAVMESTQPKVPSVAPTIQQEAAPSKTEMTPKGGSSMKIPESSEAHLSNYQNQHIYHTVGEDETINDIAMKYGTSINALKLLNEMGEGEVLIPFQKIKVR